MTSLFIAFVGALLIVLGLVMSGSRAGYFYFVVGPKTVVILAACVTVGAWYFVKLGPG
jgi:hypothetical protein